jgi:L-ribulose-5-phosphate 3-epimerase
LKISMFTLVFRNRSIGQAMRLSKELGYEAIELWGMEPHISADTTRERAEEIKELASELELDLAGIGAYVGGFSTLSDAECERQVEDLEKYFTVIEWLGCDLIRVGPGGPNAFLAQDYHYAKAAHWMRKCGELAEEHNVRLAMEIHNNSLVETVEGAERLLEMIDRENVGLIHDAGNMYITGTDYGEESVRRLGNKIFHVHVKDELRVDDESLPGSFRNLTVRGEELFQQQMLGQGGVDHLPLFRALKKIGYSGYLSTECHAAKPDLYRAEEDLKEIKRLLAQI